MLKSGARVLLTHPKIQEFIGSTIVTYELALYLKSIGIEVTIYTYCFMEPASKIFINKDIKVIYEHDVVVNILDYDIIWVQGQIVPIDIIQQLNECNQKPIFIFHHMSALVDCSDEFPYIPDFEDDLSSLSLFVSEECEHAMMKFLKRNIQHVYYRNPVPQDYCSNTNSISKRSKLKKILIVSNHIPDEILNIKDKMKDHDILVDYYGVSQKNYGLISEDILCSYDLVITIGKTVQYCLALGIPVYIYDHFGGYGYLNDNNLSRSEKLNYSGRCGFKLSSDDIFLDIINNFNAAVDFHFDKLSYFRNRYNIKNTINEINNIKLSLPSNKIISDQKIASYIASQKFSRRFFYIWGLEHSNNRLKNHFLRSFGISIQEILNFGNLKIFRMFIIVIVAVFRCLRLLKRVFQ